jgi:hypothetical protein
MGRYIIKPEKDRDLYIEWSTIVDSPIWWGTRQEFSDEGFEEERLDRADRLGSSSMVGSSRWDDAGEIVNNVGPVTLWVKREDLIPFVESLDGDKYDPRYASILRDDEDETPIEDIEPPC